jgi:hypothetical protein
MILQCIGTIEALSAFLAAIASFATMNQAMLVEHRAGEESLIADGAQVGTLARVALPDVIVEIRTNREFTIAALLGALEWFDALMEAKMLPEM